MHANEFGVKINLYLLNYFYFNKFFMYKISRLIAIVCFIFIIDSIAAQDLKPGFDKSEYIQLLEVSSRYSDSNYLIGIPAPQRFKRIYLSDEMGLDNRWSLWVDHAKTAVICLRGTTQKSQSWLANFYAAMVPAKGSLHISDSFIFNYDLAPNPKAAVHIGWLLGTAFLSRDILPKMDSMYKSGTKNFIITGHSQGGAISFLMTAYLYSLQEQGKLPADMHFKTYCSAAPKPGNVYFAYHYESITQNGWSFNVINSADWVPQLPFSVQTLNDLNTTNPFMNSGELIKKQGFPKNILLKHIYNRISKPAIHTQKNYEKYLGKYATKMVQKYLPGFEQPIFYSSSDYERTGTTIVLQADDDYYKKFPDDPKKVFVHHSFQAYLYLSEKLKY